MLPGAMAVCPPSTPCRHPRLRACHEAFNNKILTSARNGELILWDLNKNGPSKFGEDVFCTRYGSMLATEGRLSSERRTRDHARSIHVLQYSPILQSYCMTGSADGDLRIWVRADKSSATRV